MVKTEKLVKAATEKELSEVSIKNRDNSCNTDLARGAPIMHWPIIGRPIIGQPITNSHLEAIKAFIIVTLS